MSIWDAAAQSAATGSVLTEEIWIQFWIDLYWRWHAEQHPALYPQYARHLLVLPPVLAAARAARSDVGVLPAHESAPAVEHAAWTDHRLHQDAHADLDAQRRVEPDDHDGTGSR